MPTFLKVAAFDEPGKDLIVTLNLDHVVAAYEGDHPVKWGTDADGCNVVEETAPALFLQLSTAIPRLNDMGYQIAITDRPSMVEVQRAFGNFR